MEELRKIVKERKFKYIAFFWLIISIQFIVGRNLQVYGYSIISTKKFFIDLIKIIILWIILVTTHYLMVKVFSMVKEHCKKNKKKKTKVKQVENVKTEDENQAKEGKVKKTKKLSKKDNNWYTYFIIIIACWLPVLLAFYPAIVSYDGWNQIYQYVFKNNLMYHPFITTYIFSFFYKLGFKLGSPTFGMFLFSIFQSLIMASCFAYAVEFIRKNTKQKALYIIALVFYAIFPYNQVFPLITTKDTLFAGIFLIFMIKLYNYLGEKNFKWSSYIVTLCLGTLTLFLRNNIYYIYAISIPFLILVLLKNKKKMVEIVTMLLIMIILFKAINPLGYKKIITTGSSSKNKTTVTYKAPAGNFNRSIMFKSQAVGRIVYQRGDELTDEEKEKIYYYYDGNAKKIDKSAIEEILNSENLTDRQKERYKQLYKSIETFNENRDYKFIGNIYNPGLADSTVGGLNNSKVAKNRDDFNSFTKSLMKKYPLETIDSVLDRLRGYWYINDDLFCNLYKREDSGALEIYVKQFFSEEELQELNIKDESKIPWLHTLYKKLLCENYFRKIPILFVLFQPAFYMYLDLAFLLYALYNRKTEKKRLVIATILFCFATDCCLAYCAIVRYMYEIVVCAPLMLALVFIKENDEKKTKNKVKND